MEPRQEFEYFAQYRLNEVLYPRPNLRGNPHPGDFGIPRSEWDNAIRYADEHYPLPPHPLDTRKKTPAYEFIEQFLRAATTSNGQCLDMTKPDKWALAEKLEKMIEARLRLGDFN